MVEVSAHLHQNIGQDLLADSTPGISTAGQPTGHEGTPGPDGVSEVVGEGGASPYLLHVDPLHLSFILVSHLTTWARREMQKHLSRQEMGG